MNLIVVAYLSEPPSESLPFRFVTMIAKTDLDMDVLIETERQMRDDYYKFLKRRGMMDFVSDLILPEDKEDGIRIDYKLTYPKTIRVNKITFDNVINVVGQVKFLSQMR